MRSEKLNELKKLRSLSTLLDSKFHGPFGFRFGLDGLLGLIPYFGDLVTTGISIYILAQAVSIGCSRTVALRMAFNIFFENLTDMIPIFGNIFDFFWKANTRNVDLLEGYLLNPRGTEVKSRFFVGSILAGIILVLIASGIVTFYVLSTIFHWIQ